MTHIDYRDSEGREKEVEAYWGMIENNPRHRGTPLTEIFKMEDDILKGIEDNGGKVISIKTTLMNKRRYKRKRAKALKRGLVYKQ